MPPPTSLPTFSLMSLEESPVGAMAVFSILSTRVLPEIAEVLPTTPAGTWLS